jgi:hypothetical protein
MRLVAEKYLRRAVEDFEAARDLITPTVYPEFRDLVAAQLVVAARLEVLEDTLDTSLPDAGRGH